MELSDSELLLFLEDVNSYWQMQQEIGDSLSKGFFQLTLARKSVTSVGKMTCDTEDMRFEMDPMAHVIVSTPSSSSSSSSFSSFSLSHEKEKKVLDPLHLVTGIIKHFLQIFIKTR